MPNPTRLALLALALCLVTAPLAQAQSLEDQAEAAEAYAQGQATSAQEDPAGYADNATDASWQAQQVNWTQAWSCDTASAIDEDARQALVEAGACPEVEDPAAGQEEDEDEEENQTQADADELGNDTGAALDDQVAATEALVNDTTEDPADAPDHLAKFLDRTRDAIERLLGVSLDGVEGAAAGLAMDVAGILAEAAGATAGATTATAATLTDGAMRVIQATGDGIGATVDATEAFVTMAGHVTGAFGGHMAGVIGDAASATGQALEEGASAMADAVAATAQAAADAVQDLVHGGDQETSGQPASDTVDRVSDRVPGPELELPVDV